MQVEAIKNGLWEETRSINMKTIEEAFQSIPTEREFVLYTGPQGVENFEQAFREEVSRYTISADPVATSDSNIDPEILIYDLETSTLEVVHESGIIQTANMTQEEIFNYLDNIDNE